MAEQTGTTIWLTGLSGSGKTTIARELEKQLNIGGYTVQRLDGDIVRDKLALNLKFTKKDRIKNIKINSFIASLLTKNNIITICSFISPYNSSRNQARKEIEKVGKFIEVFVDAPLALCEERDVKGLYKKARKGIIKNFTGISDPYEIPINPEIRLKTGEETVKESTEIIINYLKTNNFIR